MNDAFTIFFLGFIWLFGLAVQTITISRKGKMYVETAIIVFALSIVWVILLRKLTVSSGLKEAISYALGTVVGAIAGKLLTEKYEELFQK